MFGEGIAVRRHFYQISPHKRKHKMRNGELNQRDMVRLRVHAASLLASS
jgi:hypothetical protein